MRFLPLADNILWKQYPVLGGYGPLFWKSIIFWNVSLLAKATSFSVAIFDMGFFFFPFTVIDLKKKKNYKISKTSKNAATWWMHILIPKMSQRLADLFFKEKNATAVLSYSHASFFLFPETQTLYFSGCVSFHTWLFRRPDQITILLNRLGLWDI